MQQQQPIRLSVLSHDELIGASLRGQCPKAAHVVLQTTQNFADIEATSFRATDIVVIDLDLAGDMGRVHRLATQPDAPIVAVMASHGHGLHTLEHTLTLAELRGASVAFPKPVAADEIAAANTLVLARRIAAITGGSSATA
jgi:hypothetical protein